MAISLVILLYKLCCLPSFSPSLSLSLHCYVKFFRFSLGFIDCKVQHALTLSSTNLNQEDVTSLRAKVAVLEEELRKSRQEASDNHNLCCQLEKVYFHDPFWPLVIHIFLKVHFYLSRN